MFTHIWHSVRGIPTLTWILRKSVERQRSEFSSPVKIIITRRYKPTDKSFLSHVITLWRNSIAMSDVGETEGENR